MGLDVYLYHAPDRQRWLPVEEQYEKRSNEIYEDVVGEDRRDERMAKLETARAALGLDEDGSQPDMRQIQEPSKRHPQHYFKVGYFRSSYNDGGINRVFQKLIGKDGLYWLFEDPDEYEFRPDWARVKARCAELIEEVRARVASDGGVGLQVMEVDSNMFVNPDDFPDSANAALELYRKETSREGGPQCSYSTREGHFFRPDKPLHVLALIPGTRNLFGTPRPITYAVYGSASAAEGDETEPFEWYIQAVEIVAETCDYVLGQPDPENYYLHWSS